MTIDQALERPSPSATGVPTVLSCTALRKAYGERVAVDGVSFDVAAGTAYGLVGPNGAGKSTTIRMVCGVLSPDCGSVTIEGRDLAGRAGRAGRAARAARAALGYVPERVALFPTLSLTENLGFWAQMQGVPRRRRRVRIDEVLECVGLADRARDTVDHCSNGMQRRLNLAVALLHEPKLLVLDEVTVGVDPQSRASLLDLLGRMRDEGTAVLYTSHYMEEVERLSDRVGIVDHGRMLVEGTPADLLDAHPGAGDLEDIFLELTGRGLRD